MVFLSRSFLVSLLLVAGLPASGALAATYPPGFIESLVDDGLDVPSAMQIAPDGRIFVCEQGGDLRVIKNGQLLPTPFVSLSVNALGERGLLGVAIDPNYATNRFVYVYYTTSSAPIHNRISRFTADASGDVAVPGSEFIVMELDNLSAAQNHNGGAIDFGADGKLYVAVGDNANGENAQSLSTRHGKMLRINPNGSIPDDNPFNQAQGLNRAIWAMGLRNPFTFAFNGSRTRMFINDVGEQTWEEINDGLPGANYGWPRAEGPAGDNGYTRPLYAYDHADGGPDPFGCAITGGAFYTPATPQFPADYAGDYFFADICGGFIRRYDPATDTSAAFGGGIVAPVDLKVTADGSLYYLSRSVGAVYRVTYNAGPTAPSITTHPANRTISVGGSATFTVAATGTAPLQYQWQRGTTDIPGANGASYTFSGATLSDNGATFRVRVSNGAGNALSNHATLTVTTATNNPPVATITQPAVGALYSGGSVISYAGTGTDQQDGTLPASAFSWRVDFHHDTHSHPFIAETPGARSGSFTIPTSGETSANVWYRIFLTVRDAGGLTHTVQRDISPRKVRLTLNTSPAGLQVRLDGQPRTAPLTFDAVVGIVRNLGVVTPQAAGNANYEFVSWSDGGAAAHDVATPAADTTYTATYRAIVSGPGSPPPPTLSADVNGLSLSLWWTAAPGALSYRLEAGSAADGTDLLNADVGPTTSLQQIVPAGTYYVRVRSVGPGGVSAPSNEMRVMPVGSGPCATPPPAPSGFNVQTAGLTASLSWSWSPNATSYVLEAGTASALANLVTSDVGNVRALTVTGPAGRYFTRVRAVNACGASAPSGEVPVTLACGPAPPAPTLTITNAGGILTLNWTASAGASVYRAQVGTASGLSNIFNGDLGSITGMTADARGVTGTFFVRVFAASACGTSGPSNEVIVTLA